MALLPKLDNQAELSNLDGQPGVALRKHMYEQIKHKVVGKKPKIYPNLSKARSLSPPPLKRQRSPTKISKTSIDAHTDKKELLSRNGSPTKIKKRFTEHCPQTLDCKVQRIDTEQKMRYIMDAEEMTFTMQNLDVENEMLTNELNVVNQEIADLLHRLRITEDDYHRAQQEINDLTLLNRKLESLNKELTAQIEDFKLKSDLRKNSTRLLQVVADVKIMMDTIKELGKKLRENDLQRAENTTHNVILEKELRHAHYTMQNLQCALNMSTEKCNCLEKELVAHKEQTRNMLAVKDNEIKTLQDCIHSKQKQINWHVFKRLANDPKFLNQKS